MAASANPSGGNQEGANNGGVSNGGGSSFNGGVSNGGSGNPRNAGGKENSGPGQPMKHNPGVAVDWAPEEQKILEECLVKFASESLMVRYAKISGLLNDKTVRDVALRCRWMTKKESGKRRKEDVTRKNKDKKEKAADPSTKSSAHIAMRPNIPPYAPPMIPMDNDDGISFQAIGGPTGNILEQNQHVFEQISANFAALQVHENVNLFCQVRDNILTIMNDLNDMPGIMKQMPPLPVKLNEELANSILPRTSRPM